MESVDRNGLSTILVCGDHNYSSGRSDRSRIVAITSLETRLK